MSKGPTTNNDEDRLNKKEQYHHHQNEEEEDSSMPSSSNNSSVASSSSSSPSPNNITKRIKPKGVYSLKDESDDILNIRNYTDDMINKMLSEKLNTMTMEERNHAIHEVHGVADDVTETFEILVSKLQEMDQAISVLESTETSAYNMAKQINHEYVERIKIFALRADDYDPQKAAERLVSFFTFKNQLFGSDKLCREILMDDLDENDKACFEQGTIQILKEKDRAGRTIIVMVGRLVMKHHIFNLSRLYFYVNMVAMRDETTRKKGVVFMLYSVEVPQDFLVNRAEKLARVLWLMPVKIVAAHYCYDGARQMIFEKSLSTAMESHYLCRFRSHYVRSHDESAYKLSAFGIPNFVSSDGKFDVQYIKNWIDNTRAQEKLKLGSVHSGGSSQKSQQQQQTFITDEVRSSSATTGQPIDMMSSSASSVQMMKGSSEGQQSSNHHQEAIINPGPMDLIVRKGRYSKDSKGYKQFRSLLSNRFDEYENAGYGEKWIIADAVLEDLKGCGCRFLKRTQQEDGSSGGGNTFIFEECVASESREKIGHAFRTLRKTNGK